MLNHAHPELLGCDYVVFVNSSRQYIDCTDSVCHLLGYTRAELLALRIEDISYDSNVRELFEQYLSSGSLQGDFVLQRKDRVPVPIRYRSFIFPDGCNAATWLPIEDWRQPYFAALLETDSAKLAAKVALALDAMLRHPAPDKDTQRVMDNAANALRALVKSK